VSLEHSTTIKNHQSIAWLTLERRTDALPVHYVFPRQRLELQEAVEALQGASVELSEGSHKGVIVVWDVSYDWLSGVFVIELHAH
jgi:hypothetical protein